MLYVVVGPMSAGKSRVLIETRSKLKGSCFVCKPSNYTRDGESIKSRAYEDGSYCGDIPVPLPCVYIDPMTCVEDLLAHPCLADVSNVMIDEAQELANTDLAALISRAEDRDIYLFGLNKWATGKPSWLMDCPKEGMTILRDTCDNCKAPNSTEYTHHVSGDRFKGVYHALCPQCWKAVKP